jgi:hypothetical protein
MNRIEKLKKEIKKIENAKNLEELCDALNSALELLRSDPEDIAIYSPDLQTQLEEEREEGHTREDIADFDD